MTPEQRKALPEHVAYEHYTCNREEPTGTRGTPGRWVRCRKRARIYMDGIGYCDDHEGEIPDSLLHFARRIRYEVGR